MPWSKSSLRAHNAYLIVVLISCIAISGLASHPFGSWKQRGSNSNFMWLRDALPRDITRIRSIIYGYDTSLVMSESFQTVEDIAITFIARLKSIGRTSFTAKPIVFLAHSLGGILLKQALVEMASRGEMENFIFSTTREIIFFGTPNRGMHMRHLLPMVKGQPNASLVKLLSPTSVYLSQLDEQFSGLALIRDVRILSFYETKQSHTTLVIPIVLSPQGPKVLTFSLSKLPRGCGNGQGLSRSLSTRTPPSLNLHTHPISTR
jgi:hypothetical protein